MHFAQQFPPGVDHWLDVTVAKLGSYFDARFKTLICATAELHIQGDAIFCHGICGKIGNELQMKVLSDGLTPGDFIQRKLILRGKRQVDAIADPGRFVGREVKLRGKNRIAQGKLRFLPAIEPLGKVIEKELPRAFRGILRYYDRDFSPAFAIHQD